MQKNIFTKYTLLFFFITLLLIPGFFENRLNIVPTDEYTQWQRGWESLMVARLVKSRQDGMFSAGGLSGIGDVTEWDLGKRTIDHQYATYEGRGKYKTYFAYKSFPGFQGFFYSGFDAIANLPPAWTIKLLRAAVALFTSMVLALFSIGLFVEFGWLASALVILFIILSKWFVLPAGNIYWNLWSFYLSPVVIMFYLAFVSKKGFYPEAKIYWILFISALIKILFSGFEFITTYLLMSTVPLVYFSVRDNWGWKVFTKRIFRAGSVLLAAAVTGLIILLLQISAYNRSFSGAAEHILDTVNRRAIGDPETFSFTYAKSLQISVISVVWEYLNIPAIDFIFLDWNWQINFLHLIILFAIFTGLFIFGLNKPHNSTFRQKGKALMIAVWVSIIAPLSWLIIFKPHSYLHPFLNPIVWQMPFTLLGLAFCGLILQELRT